MKLPSPVELERICKGLATLDAILCEDWGSRYYSFDVAWGGDHRMASMRNGCGDEWFILFAPGGVFVKAFWHEYPHEDVATIYSGLPSALQPQLVEPAFSMEHVTFGGWHDGASWTLRGNDEPMREELAILSGDPAVYRAYASSYFGLKIPLDAVSDVLAGKPFDASLVQRLSASRTLEDLAADLATIGH